MSETPKWTPGPWTADRIDMPETWGYIEINGPGDTPIAQMDHGQNPTEADWANARLIAAAPELYEEHYTDDQLLMQMATVILNDEVADWLPYGLRERVEQRLKRGTPALTKARGES